MRKFRPNSWAIEPTLLRLVIVLGLVSGVIACQLQENEGQKRVKYFLKDPASAEFRGAQMFKQQDGDQVYCGEVNSKNGYGALSGFSKYVVIGNAVFLEDDGQFIYKEQEEKDLGGTLTARITIQIAKLNAENRNLENRINRVITNSKSYSYSAIDVAWERCK
ncbi:MAG: hypothetical protein U1A72_06350 [Sulfuritalea sp.]|nr:hypothetical protein [Sulfuritalea sp.]